MGKLKHYTNKATENIIKAMDVTKTMTSERNAQISQARETFQMLFQISQLLSTGLDAESLTICLRLCELGVDPEVLARVIKEIRKMGENSVTQNKTLNIR